MLLMSDWMKEKRQGHEPVIASSIYEGIVFEGNDKGKSPETGVMLNHNESTTMIAKVPNSAPHAIHGHMNSHIK